MLLMCLQDRVMRWLCCDNSCSPWRVLLNVLFSSQTRADGSGAAHLSAERGDHSTARDRRMQMLRARASTLVTFAGYVQGRLNRPADTTSKLAAMDVHIM